MDCRHEINLAEGIIYLKEGIESLKASIERLVHNFAQKRSFMKCPQCGFEEKRKGHLTDIQFGIFWMNYPRKIGKGAAEKVWFKIKGDDELFDKIVRAVNEQKNGQSWTRDNGIYIPHPATWLNQRRWEDEAERKAFQPPEPDQDRMAAAEKRLDEIREREYQRILKRENLK